MTEALLFVTTGSLLAVGIATLVIAALTLRDARKSAELAEGCLEYIRERYPDFKLMFLCNSNWESNFDWCVEQNIGAYIQTGCFDKNTVTRFHEKDLKVGVWTLNTDALYKVYGNYGCDFIAVDYLDTVDLPELDDQFHQALPKRYAGRPDSEYGGQDSNCRFRTRWLCVSGTRRRPLF